MSRPRLFGALLKRELDLVLAALALAVVVGCLLVAREIFAAGAAGVPAGLMLIVRRLDVTLLFVMALVMMLRIASRAEADHVTAWAAPLCAAACVRAHYGIGIAVSAFAAAAVVFVAGATAFAAGVRVFGSSPELVHALPRTLGGGILILGCFSVYTTGFAMLLKRTYATVFLATALIVVPYILTLPYLRYGGMPPRWLYVWLTSYPPPLVLPGDMRGCIHAVGYVIAGLLVLGAVSRRYALRQT